MGGGGAAAAAHDGGPGIDEGGDILRELLRTYREDGLPAYDLRQSRVWLDRDRKRGGGGETLQEGQHPVGAESAVEAEGIHAQTFKKRRHAFHACTGQELAVVADGDRGEYRQRRILLCGEDCGLELVGVAHRLDCDKVCAGSRADAHLFGECIVGGVEFEVACRLEQTSRGADVERDETPPAGHFRRLACDGDSCRDHILKRGVAVVLGAVRAERVGVNHIRSGREIGFMDGADVIRPRQVPQFRDLARLQAFRLELRPHRPVEEERTLSPQCREVYRIVLHGRDYTTAEHNVRLWRHSQ